YNNGIRIGNNNGDSTASLYLGCIKTATNTTQSGQWEISKTSDKALQINPSKNKDYTEGLRISSSTNNQCSNVQFGCDSNQTYGFIDNQWLVGTPGGDFLNPLGFVIVKAGEQITPNRGLQISADGNTLTFNGRVL
ncbi:MAG: hypothetical protein EZS28_048776, partial [Streblomastix strix]